MEMVAALFSNLKKGGFFTLFLAAKEPEGG